MKPVFTMLTPAAKLMPNNGGRVRPEILGQLPPDFIAVPDTLALMDPIMYHQP
jgi:hypothetical protein